MSNAHMIKCAVSFVSSKLCTEAHVYQLRGIASTLACAQPYHPGSACHLMDSCFALIGAHQHGIAVGSMSWLYNLVVLFYRPHATPRNYPILD